MLGIHIYIHTLGLLNHIYPRHNQQRHFTNQTPPHQHPTCRSTHIMVSGNSKRCPENPIHGVNWLWCSSPHSLISVNKLLFLTHPHTDYTF
nr:hypothetical protein MACL_00000679 [Theileria orientalis]